MRFVLIILFISVLIGCSFTKQAPSVTLKASAPGAKTFHWYQVSGPAPIIINSPNNPETKVSVNAPIPGTYVMGVTVTDSAGRTGTGTKPLTVKNK